MMGFMAIEPVKIPQNVYVEDRIIGPLTIRQVLLTALGGGVSYVLWAMLQKSYGQSNVAIAIIAWIPCVVMILFAFVKVNDLSLARILLLLAERSQKTPIRTFSPRQGLSVTIRTFALQQQEKELPHTKLVQQSRIEEISSLVDTPPEQSQEPQPQPVDPQRIAVDPLPTVLKNPNGTPTPPQGAGAQRGTVSVLQDIHT